MDLLKKNISFKELSQFIKLNCDIINISYNQNWDWKYLVMNTNIILEFNSCPLDLIEEYPEKFKWKYMGYNRNLTKKFILDNIERFDKNSLRCSLLKTKYYNLKLEDIYYFKDILNLDITKCDYVTDYFISQHKNDNLNIQNIINKKLATFEQLSQFKYIDEDIIDRYYNENWNWGYLINYTNIIFKKNSCSLNLIEKYPDRFNWYWLGSNPNVTEEFMLKHNDKNWSKYFIINKINFENLYKFNMNDLLENNIDISDFIFNNKDKNWNIYELIEKNILNFKKLSQFENINKYIIDEYYEQEWDWKYIIDNTNIIFLKNSAPLDLILLYPYRFCREYIIYNKNINNIILMNKDIELYYKNYIFPLEDTDDNELLDHPDISNDFILKYKDKNWDINRIIKLEILTFQELSKLIYIDKYYINKYYLENWDWIWLLKNTNIIFEKNSCPLHIIDKYFNRFRWNYMGFNPNITKEFILKHNDKDWFYINKNIE